MILGRPYQLWLGLSSAITGFIAYVVVNVGHTDPEVTLGIVAGINAILLALMLLLSNQPPQLAPGDQYKVITPAGQPNETRIVGASAPTTTPIDSAVVPPVTATATEEPPANPPASFPTD